MKPTGATKEAAGHSPLPWLVPDSDFEKVCTGDGLTIADTYDRRRPDLSLSKPVHEANAQLIVTAVNERERLRAAMQKFVDAYAGGKAAWLGNGQARRSLDEFRQLLNDATPGTSAGEGEG